MISDNCGGGTHSALSSHGAEEEATSPAPTSYVGGTPPPLFEDPSGTAPGGRSGETPSLLFESTIFCLFVLQKASTIGSNDSQSFASRFEDSFVPTSLNIRPSSQSQPDKSAPVLHCLHLRDSNGPPSSAESSTDTVKILRTWRGPILSPMVMTDGCISSTVVMTSSLYS